MKPHAIGLLLTVVWLSPAAAQEAAGAPKERAQMYEDIEVMRRLLNGKLEGFAGAGRQNSWIAWTQACTNCHGGHAGVRWNASTLLTPNQYFSTYRPTVGVDPNNTWWLDATGLVLQNPHWMNRWHVAAAPALDTEGTYLKGQGVVFTLTLPPPARDPRPDAPKSPPPPPSDWERIRREVRQEKPAADAPDKKPKEPTLAEVILKALAENGKHFTQLGENESLTVVITFRHGSAHGQGVAFADIDRDGWLDLYLTNYDTIYDAGLRQFKPLQGPADPGGGQPAPVKQEDTLRKKVLDLILLGELHLKQGKTEEAINAFRQAHELKPTGDQAREVLRKLAAALLVAGKDAEAEQVMKQFAALAKQPDKPKELPKADVPKPAPLPSKLIVSVPKKLLDQVGSPGAAGSISFEEFQKAATVEYLTFPEKQK